MSVVDGTVGVVVAETGDRGTELETSIEGARLELVAAAKRCDAARDAVQALLQSEELAAARRAYNDALRAEGEAARRLVSLQVERAAFVVKHSGVAEGVR